MRARKRVRKSFVTGSETRYLSFDGHETLLLAAHKVDVIKLCYISALIDSVSIRADNWNFPESVCELCVCLSE